MKKITLILMALAVISLLSFSAVTVSVEKPAQPPAQTELSLNDLAIMIGCCTTEADKTCNHFQNCPGNCGKQYGDQCMDSPNNYCTMKNRTCCPGYSKVWSCAVG